MVQREYRYTLNSLKDLRSLRSTGKEVMVLELCRSLLASGGGSISEERCRLFLEGFQEKTALCRRELAAFPLLLRQSIIEALAQVCSSMQYAADTEKQAQLFAALFGSLRLLSHINTEKLLEAVDLTNAIFSSDPTGEYSRMDSRTRQDYLRQAEKLAAKKGLSEQVFAKGLIEEACRQGRHIGFLLFPEKKHGAGLYIAFNVLLTLFLSILLSISAETPAALFLLLLPVSELVKSLTDYILLHLIPPTRLPRMDMQQGVPEDGRSICVISSLLTGRDSIERQAKKLEQLSLACRSEGKNLSFGILADFPAADSETAEGDGELLAAGRIAVNSLNLKYGGGFYLFTRPRSFDGEKYTGAERKRGAVTELARLLCDEDSSLQVYGERDALSGIKYILTLDSDTQIYPGSAGELIGAMLHPLCRPVLDSRHNVVAAGHGIIHPRMDTELSSANASDFSIIFAGAGGSDSYGAPCSELYMDAFSSGGFAGKGIIDAKMLLQCTAERLPKGRILSHDALEGAYLRGAYMGDAEFSDAFPASLLSYYRRLHRWVRGDWQNLPFIFARELPDIERWRLFDSLRRSLISPMTLLAIVLGFFIPKGGIAIAAWAALLSLLSRLFLSLAQGSTARHEKVHLRRRTRLLTGVGGAIVQTFIRLWLLPWDAWVCISAACTALWRMYISHRKLLQWQTAEQADREKSRLLSYFRAMWPAVLLGGLLLAFSPQIIGKSSGLMWLLSPAAAAALALPSRKVCPLSEEDRDFLVKSAAEAWHYYEELTTEEDNFLPPDNFQEQPPVGTAHRSSPTNIGLALTAAAAASDMGIISQQRAAEYISAVLNTLEQMPRCMGHFYNWYDTRSLLPLSPAYISTVDSGNLYAGLLTARRFMLELGEPSAAERIKKLMVAMDFAPLYDRERGLFYICFDAAGQRSAGGWYDLLASEAMLTSYIAVSKGDIPKKHWRMLSRAQLQKDGYRGLASWTGTMFEYLMPELFLPFYRGSLLWESGRFCVYAQRRRVSPGRPWGISESAFFSLDPALSYRYKAHGCASLSLKRGQDRELVISPYSSFLALAAEPAAAVRNLRRLSAMGASGRFGFMDALDFTAGRCRREDGEQVRCYMTHHLSMSIIAAANAVCGGSIQRRFMSEPAMAAHALLLQEKLPASGIVIRRDSTDIPEKPERVSGEQWQLRGGSDDTEKRLSLLSNGSYSLLLANSGSSEAFLAGLCIYRFPGIKINLVTGKGKTRLFPCLSPEMWEFSEEHCRFTRETEGISFSLTVSTASGDCGELRCLELEAENDCRAGLEIGFEPLLSSLQDYSGHPAYCRLGLQAEYGNKFMLIHRLRRGSKPDIWLCLASDTEGVYAADRKGALSHISQPLLSFNTALSLRAGCRRRLAFSFCLADRREDALAGAQRILASGVSLRGSMVAAASALLGLSSAETGAAMELLPLLHDPPLREAAARKELWRWGISGELPIICCEIRASESEKLLRRFCLLKSCGVNADLVYISDEQGEYRRPACRKISELLSAIGLEALIGSSGGVHFVPPEAEEVLLSRAAFSPAAKRDTLPQLKLPAPVRARSVRCVPEYFSTDDAFCFEAGDCLPQRIWQLPLSNGRLGCIAADFGPAGLWYENARELQILRFPESISALRGQETFSVSTRGRDISIFAANDGFKCRVEFYPGCAVWEKKLGSRLLRSTLFISRDRDVRILMLEGAEGMEFRWAMQPSMGLNDSSSLICRSENGIFTAENPECYLSGVKFSAAASVPVRIKTDFTPSAMLMSGIADRCSIFVCGTEAVNVLSEFLSQDAVLSSLEALRLHWADILGRFQVDSGCAEFDRYMSRWALYQVIACRLEGRSSLYQSGGAVGFRDQLQDAVNLILIDSSYAEKQILDCCRHQYIEGDVMHWWHRHPEGDRGVRTRCSDDLLWLCWALCEYVEKTGDTALCFEETGYISSPVLSGDEHDRYEKAEKSGSSASVLLHARSALELCVSRGTGSNGLPLFGSGDWNDGLDSTGGESVWLAWFFSHCALRFSGLLERLGEKGAQHFRELSEEAARAADRAWGGRWYLRGFDAAGNPLGGRERIDSTVQSWACFCEASDNVKNRIAVKAALSALADREHRLIKLFTPPYSFKEPYIGYISGYGEGFRENGGQYTHGAVWLAAACFKLGLRDEGRELMELLLPETHDASVYGAEPFVLPADVYSAPGHEGEAGWSWYTGSAGWYFRVAAEEFLGLELRDGRLYLDPALPSLFPQLKISWRDKNSVQHCIEVSHGELFCDGSKYGGGPI